MEKLRVGYLSNSYAYQRNILDVVETAEYKKVLDFYKIFSALANKAPSQIRARKSIRDWQFKFNDLNLNNVDILHFFNTISFGKTPWISTFETLIPRMSDTLSIHWGAEPDFSNLVGNKSIEYALQVLAKPACRKLIAMSECNLRMQKELLEYFPKYKNLIAPKLCVMHPPQELIVNGKKNKLIDSNETIKFMFVGRAFFRKGGMEILQAFKTIYELNQPNLELIIVSNLEIDNYATQETGKDVEIARKIIYENSQWIRYYPNLPNQDVLSLMQEAHVGLLPTWADTYGYSVLEFQASGCPVISTDIRALPEINNPDIGWLIHIPQNRLCEAIYTTSEGRNAIKEAIQRQLEIILGEILENRAILAEKSRKSINQIKANHSPLEYTRKMKLLYEEAI
jgi:glycosyltransferase involved in cell wall biosynthesis